jgi:hypothetical protein
MYSILMVLRAMPYQSRLQCVQSTKSHVIVEVGINILSGKMMCMLYHNEQLAVCAINSVMRSEPAALVQVPARGAVDARH